MTAVETGALAGFIGALRDDDAEQLYDRAPCGYLSTTPDGRVVKVNQTLLDLTGYRREDVVGQRSFSDLLSKGGQIYHETHFAPLLRMHGSVREIALTMVRSDGSRLPVLVNSVLERDGSGEPLVVRHAVFDATERRRYEREVYAAKERAERSEAHVAALARTLQNSLIPPTPPHIPGLDVAARYRPAGDGAEVGGDFYDVFQIGDDDWAVVIGDVCGKGVDAAVVTALVRHTVRAAAVPHPQPRQVLLLLNEVLQRHESERFCTVAYLRLRRDDEGWRLVLCSGGHPLPLLKGADGAVRSIGRPGSLIGVVDEPELHDVSLRVRPGELVVLCTDGVTEGRRGREFYGERRLDDLVAALPGDADRVASAVLDDVLDFQRGTARDDIAVVVLGVPAG